MLQPLSVRLGCHLSRGVSLGSAAAPQTRDSEPRRGAPFPGPAARPRPVCPWPPPPGPKPGPCVSLCSRSPSPGGHVPADAIRWGAKSLLVSSPHLCPPPPLLAGGTDVTSLVPPSRPPSCCRSGPSTRPFPTRRRRQSFAVRETWRGELWSAAPRSPAVADGRGVSPLPGVRRPHPQRRPDGGVGAARPPLPCWKLSRRVHLVYPVLSNFPFIPSLVIQKCASSFPNT